MNEREAQRSADREMVTSFLRDRSEANFRSLYRRHNPRLLSLARKLASRGNILAEDAIQETWMRATRLLPKFAFRSSLNSWLTGILLNVIHELSRATGADPTSDWADPEQGTALGGLEPFESLALVDALRRLPAGFRMVVALHDIEGFTHAEISEALGIDSGTSKSQLARARQQLRSKLIDLQ